MSETADILINMLAAFPNFKPADPAKTARVYLSALETYPIGDVRWAAENLIQKSKFFPSVSEFTAEIDRVMRLQARPVANPLRAAELSLEEQAVDGEFVPGQWEALAKQFEAAGRVCAAAALRKRVGRLVEVLG